MSNHKQSDKKSKSGYTLATPNLSKDNERYWQSRVFRHKRNNGKGQEIEDSTYSARISYQGRRKAFQLDTANKKIAAVKARDIYRKLTANGWDEAIEDHSHVRPSGHSTTVGDVIRVYSEFSEASAKTAANYTRVFRTVVADIKKISGDKKRFDYVNGGAEKWRQKVDNTLLSEITPRKIQRWKLAYVKERSDDPVKERSAKETVNSYIRYCRSLFSIKVLPYMKELKLPEELPFSKVKLYKRQSMRYKSTFDISDLIMEAKKKLPGIEQDQQWLIFTLAVSTGLRRNEIDKLTWRQINFDKNLIALDATKYFKPKSENSGTEVSIDSELSELLRGYHAKHGGKFVLQSDVRPLLKSKVPQYRANRHFEALIKWLRRNGVESQKPIHTLRKEAGSLVNKMHGLYAASTFLRHADIQVTSAHYVENKEVITSGLGAFLAGNIEDIEQGRKAE
jgi:integrase